MEENRKTNKTAVIIAIVLSAVGIIANVIQLFDGFQSSHNTGIAVNLFYLIAYVVALAYGISGYSKPHSNALKNAYLIFAIALAFVVIEAAKEPISWPALIIQQFCIIPVAFFSGRLHKLEENKALTLGIGALFVIASILKLTGLSAYEGAAKASVASSAGGMITLIISFFSPFILWTVLCIFYIARYKEHAEAGLKISKEELARQREEEEA